MGQITINGTNIQSLDNAFVGGASPTADTWFYSLPPFGEAPKVGVPQYDELQFVYPAVDGIALKRMGFRGRTIHIDLCVFGTKAQIETKFVNFFNGSTGVTKLARYSIIFPGNTTFQGCKLVKGQGVTAQWFVITDIIGVLIPLDFFQYSESN